MELPPRGLGNRLRLAVGVGVQGGVAAVTGSDSGLGLLSASELIENAANAKRKNQQIVKTTVLLVLIGFP